MEFEFDAAKSASNKEKHGIDFLEAQSLWLDIAAVEYPSKVLSGEPRFLVVGKIGQKHWTAAITYRGVQIRIISCRRSREEEVKIYEG